MLLGRSARFTITLLVCDVLCSEDNAKPVKPYAFPVPFELPNRNDRADQCWLRIEDVALTETVAVYCTIAHAFLRGHIRDYNSRKMVEDNVDVSLWSEPPQSQVEEAYRQPPDSVPIKDWKATTLLDPITRMRLYVTKYADCRLIMSSREAMTNYQVDCEKVLFLINDRSSGGAVFSRVQNILISLCLVLLFI